MRVMVTLVVLAFLGLLQVTCAFWPSREYYYRRNGIRHNTHAQRLELARQEESYQNYNYYWGQRKQSHSALATNRVYYSYRDFRDCLNTKSSTTQLTYNFIGNVTVDVTYPSQTQRFDCPISYIQVKSVYGEVGYVCVTGGGVGYNYVTFNFVSNFNYGLDFIVWIYGQCKPC